MDLPFLVEYRDSRRTGVALHLKVQPRSSRSGPLEVHGAQLKWAVHAAPADNAANTELVRSVADHFGLPQRKVRLLKGAASRSKVILLEGLTPEQVEQTLNLSPRAP